MFENKVLNVDEFKKLACHEKWQMCTIAGCSA